jgi:hypothetical protein
MSTLLITPTNIDDYDWIFKNPVSGKWTIPVLEFNPLIFNPFYLEIDPLNVDPRYQNRTIDYFHTKLTEKWLYRDPMFRSLLKYFHVTKKGDKGTVTLISDPEKVSKEKLTEDEEKYIFKYIEKFFITKRFVEKVLREYVAVAHVKWYDLYSNSDTLKDLFRHKLKKIIVKTIYSIEKD